MQAAQLPAKFPIPFANNAVATDIQQIPQGSQIGIVGGAASLVDGFPPLTFLPVGGGGVPPWGRDFNGLFNQITAWVRYNCNAGGLPAFDPAFSTAIGGYPLGSLIATANKIGQGAAHNEYIWFSVIDNNTINPDTTFGGSGAWVAIATIQGVQNEAYISADDTSAVPNIINMAPQPPPNGYVKYQRYQTLIANTTTGSGFGSVVLNVNGVTGPLGARNVIYADGSPPTPLMLRQGEVGMFVFDGNNFQLENRVPSPLIGSQTIFVRTDGNDNNSGFFNTPSGAMLTIQAALTRAQNIFFLQGLVLNIIMGIPGTYAPFQVPPMNGDINIQGLTSTASSYVIQGPAPNTQGMVIAVGANVTLQNMTIVNTGGVATCVSNAGANMAFGNVTFLQAASTGNPYGILAAGPGGAISLTSQCTFAANAVYMMVANQGKIGIPPNSPAGSGNSTIVISGNPAFSAAVMSAQSTGSILFSTAFATPFLPATFTGTAQGVRFICSLNGVISTNTSPSNVNYIPGTAPGVTVTGGQYQ